MPLKKFFNTSGLVYKEMQLKVKLPSMSEEEQLKLLAENGMLIKRPMVICEDKVFVGFKETEWEVLKNKRMLRNPQINEILSSVVLQGYGIIFYLVRDTCKLLEPSWVKKTATGTVLVLKVFETRWNRKNIEIFNTKMYGKIRNNTLC